MQVEKTVKKVADQKRKLCKKCNKEKNIDCFRQYKSGKNKGYYYSYCSDCNKLYRENYFKRHLWRKNYKSAKDRCADKNRKTYYGRGIKFLLTMKEVAFLWKKYKAEKMKSPTIDRIDNDGHYELKNCQFIERTKNGEKGSNNMWRKRNANKLKERKIKSVWQQKRFEKQLTQKYVANQVGITQASLSDIERGIHEPTEEHKNKLEQILC